MLYADHFKLHAASRSVHSLPSLLVAADALRNPELVTVFCKGNVKNCDWLELKQHYSTTGAAAKEMPFGCRAKDSECYVQRYPDLLQGFCGGSVQGCDWFRVVEHWSRVGLTEARVFSCAPHPNPDHNPNPNPNPNAVQEGRIPQQAVRTAAARVTALILASQHNRRAKRLD